MSDMAFVDGVCFFLSLFVIQDIFDILIKLQSTLVISNSNWISLKYFEISDLDISDLQNWGNNDSNNQI